MTEHDKLRHPECKRCVDWQDSIDYACHTSFTTLRQIALLRGFCPHGKDSECPELVAQEQADELYRRATETPLLGDRR